MDGLHTVIELATPATVKFEARNMLLFDGLVYRVVGNAPPANVEIDAESEDTDEFVRGFYDASQIIEAQAKLLLVQTISLRRIKKSDLTGVYRLEKLIMADGVPSFLQVLPYNLEITGYSSRKKQTPEKMAGNHATLVERVMRDFAANTPRIQYNGPFMDDALMEGEREVSERINKRAQEESAAYWAKRQ